jgi:hypothetical protein
MILEILIVWFLVSILTGIFYAILRKIFKIEVFKPSLFDKRFPQCGCDMGLLRNRHAGRSRQWAEGISGDPDPSNEASASRKEGLKQ